MFRRFFKEVPIGRFSMANKTVPPPFIDPSRAAAAAAVAVAAAAAAAAAAEVEAELCSGGGSSSHWIKKKK
ncbi:hypothetical protein M0802_010782 [Mischocyttarus mexicanus]|nr:hypothetical protein M0802_010782 [Mischocyttarus mexicanus]